MKNRLFKDMKRCPFCGRTVTVRDMSFGKIAGKTYRLEVDCVHCGTIIINAPSKDPDNTYVYGNPEAELDAYHDVWQMRFDRSEDDLK